MLLKDISILKMNITVTWLALIVYTEEFQGQISIQRLDNMIELYHAPPQLLETNARIIPTIRP
jgi:hypothetical protein